MFKHFRLSRVVGILLATAPLFALALISDSSAVTKFNIKVDPSIELVLDNTSPSVVLDSPDGEVHQTTIDALVTTNNPTGYVLAVLMNGTELTNQVNPNYSIPTLEEQVDQYHFVPNRWGLLGGDGLYHPAYSGYVISNTDAPATSAAEQVVVGVKVDAELPSGTYDCDLTIVALANRIPYTIDVIDFLQDIDEDVIDSMVEGEQHQLMDERDGKVYFVSKLKDGNVWMTQNLDFELSAEGTTLNPETSDVIAPKTVTVSTNTATWGQDATLAYYKDGGDLYRPNGLDAAADSSALDSDGDDQHYQLGSYYSWNAATAGSGSTAEVGAVATESICPKGWKLPTASETFDDIENGEFNKVFGKYFSKTYEFISHTPNVRDDGTNNGNYANGLNPAGQVFTAPGATKIHIKLKYATESCCDRVVIWPGAHPEYKAGSHNSSTYGAVAYAGSSSGYIERDFDGDSVTIGFTSDGSVSNYGYHAIITGLDANGELMTYIDLPDDASPVLTANPLWINYSGFVDDTNDWTASLRSASYWSSVSAENNKAVVFNSQETVTQTGEGEGEGEGEGTTTSTFDALPNRTTDITKGLNVRCVAAPAAYTIH